MLKLDGRYGQQARNRIGIEMEWCLPGKSAAFRNHARQQCKKIDVRRDRKGGVSVKKQEVKVALHFPFFSKYSFIASFTMSLKDIFFSMARNFMRV